MTQQEHSAVTEGAAIQQTPAETAPPETAPPGQGLAISSNVAGRPVPADQQNDPNRVASAPTSTAGVPHESLFDMAQVPPDRRPQAPGSGAQPPADQTQIKTFPNPNGEGQVEAAATPRGDVGPFGAALPPGGEVAGGGIVKVLDPPPDPTTVNQPLTRERAALLSPIGRKLAPYIQRPPAEWGVIAPGDVIRGHMLLLNLQTGEKVRAMDGHVVNPGELYLNLRNLPESLASGDTIQQILSAV